MTDGKIAIFFYGNGDLVCFDADGTRRWARNVQKDYGPFAFFWTFSSSPLLYDGKLYLQVLQRDVPVRGRGLTDRANESYLLALDPETGKTLWRARPPEPGRRGIAGGVHHADPLRAPRPQGAVDRRRRRPDRSRSGDRPRNCGAGAPGTPTRSGHWRLGPPRSPATASCSACAPKGDPIYAVKAGGAGVLDDRAVAWVSREAKEVSSDVPTPAFYDGDFFVLSDSRKCLSRVEPQTGKVKWTVPTPRRAKYEASPLAADGKIYLINFDGQVAVINAANGETLYTISMDEPVDEEVVRASIVAAYGQLFIRTTRKLYCVGNRQD